VRQRASENEREGEWRENTHTVATRRELRTCDFAAQSLQDHGVLDGVTPLLFARGREKEGGR